MLAKPELSTSSRSASQSKFRTDVIVCLSLANLAYLRLWSEILLYKPEFAFLMEMPPRPVDYLAVTLNVLLLAAVCIGVISFIRRHPAGPLKVVSYAGFLLGAAMCINAVRTTASTYLLFLRGNILRYLSLAQTGRLVVILAVAGILVAVIWIRPIARIAYRSFLILFPFFVLTFAQTAWNVATYNPAPYLNKPTAAVLPVKPGAPRVVWIIFDELDQRLAFDKPHPTVALPELDRLRDQSLYATTAYSPATQTRYSLPGLIDGRMPLDDYRSGPSRVSERFEGDAALHVWTSRDSVFARARELGLNTALAGWYMPYCRLLNDALSRCWWCAMEEQINSNGDRLPAILVNQLRSLFETSLISPFGQSLLVHHKVANYKALLQQAVSDAADPSIGLSLLHLDVPHIPFIYNRHTRALDRANSPIFGYMDNVVLADVTLGKIRRAMEAAGVWDSSTVLVSSDHGYRYAQQIDGKLDMRVPFLLKLPGQEDHLMFTPKFNTVITKELLLAILRGEITSQESAAAWMTPRLRSIGPAR